MNATDLSPSGLPALPASTTFGAVDRVGNATICATTMGNLFGTGRMLPGLGFLLAASPANAPSPLLSVALAWSPRDNGFKAAVGGSGQNGAAMATASAMLNALKTGQAMASEVPDPGRANAIACGKYLPDNPASCSAAVDPRDSGLPLMGGG